MNRGVIVAIRVVIARPLELRALYVKCYDKVRKAMQYPDYLWYVKNMQKYTVSGIIRVHALVC